jgi:restriction endonuclease
VFAWDEKRPVTNAAGALKGKGIKVLSLFFIDRVENYAGEPPPERGAGAVDGLYPGIIRELFDEAFEELNASTL